MTPLQQLLMHQEGTGPMKDGRFFPYLDGVGKWTIGYGRNLSDNGISRDEALTLFNADIADAITDVRHCFSCYDTLSSTRQMVLVSLAFNLGRERLGKFVRFIGAVHRGAWDEAAEELLDSKAAKTQAAPRYHELARMMRTDTSEWI